MRQSKKLHVWRHLRFNQAESSGLVRRKGEKKCAFRRYLTYRLYQDSTNQQVYTDPIEFFIASPDGDDRPFRMK